MARAKAELERLTTRRLPYEFEEIEAIYRIISSPSFGVRALGSAVGLLGLARRKESDPGSIRPTPDPEQCAAGFRRG